MTKPKQYTKLEVDLIHDSLNIKLDLILAQTTKHNGRLTIIERWMWTLSGAIGIFSLLEFDRIISFFT